MIFTEEEEMTYTSLEQRTAQGYLDVFPLFIPEESASVSIEAVSYTHLGVYKRQENKSAFSQNRQ